VYVTGLALVVGAFLATVGADADEHLLAGAKAFREERFDVALVEFRVAQSLGAPDAATYAATTLVKLNRPEEAVESFGPGDGPGQDALVDYYRGLACYEARLYLCADQLMAAVGERAGPRIADLAAKVRGSIATVLAAEPSHETIDWYMARCAAERKAKRAALGAAYCREAAGLARRRSDHYRQSEAEKSPSKQTNEAGPGR
jgi:hypothetical protein